MEDKKKLKRLGIIGSVSLLTLTSCAFNPFANRPVCVYGPPPQDIEEPVTDFSSEDSYDPSENVEVDVYGPPSYWDSEFEEEEAAEEEDMTEDETDPEENQEAADE